MKSYCKRMVIDSDLIRTAIQQWRQAESGHANYWRIAKEYGSEEALVQELEREICTRTLAFKPIRYKPHTEPINHKLRMLGQESVKQQIADYTVIIAMQEFLDARIGFYQVASVKGKGSLFAGRTIRKWCEREDGYWVHLDITKCYPSISSVVVIDILRKYVRSYDVLYVAITLLNTYDRGLNIGSYFSLKMAQLVLSFGYHRIEGLQTTRRGKNRSLITHQLWYADDVYFFSKDKRNLKKAVASLVCYMSNNYNVRFHKWKICKVSSCEPVGITTFKCGPDKMVLKPDLFLRIRRAYSNFERIPNIYNARKVCSYWGLVKHSDMYDYAKRKGFDRITDKAKRYVSNYDRRIHHDGNNSIVRANRTNL